MTTELWQRNIKDATFEQTISLPDAEASVSTTPFDIGPNRASGVSREALDFAVLLLSIPACPALENGKSITFTLVHSDTLLTGFEATDPSLSSSIIGADGTGSPAKEVRFCLPRDVKQYLAVQIVADEGAGDNTAISATVQLLF